MLNHILVPLDESELSERAISHARNIIKPRGKITLLTVVPPYKSNGYSKQEAQSIILGMREHADAYLDRLCRQLRSEDIFADTLVADGDAAEQIIEIANRLNVDAVVISTHGRSGIKRWVFGSVTYKVLGTLKRPVMVIPNR